MTTKIRPDEQTEANARVREDLRRGLADVRAEIRAVRTDARTEIRTEIRNTNKRIDALDARVSTLRDDFSAHTTRLLLGLAAIMGVVLVLLQVGVIVAVVLRT